MTEIISYIPNKVVKPPRMLDIPEPLARTSWGGIESIIEDVLNRFSVKREIALEFGVEFGYSTVTLSSFFKQVIGVDWFKGDEHSRFRPDYSQDTKQCCSPYPNITLVQALWQDFTRLQPDSARYDLIHIDIVHTYEETFPCGLWACQHAPIVIFHDTESFAEVKRALCDLAEQTGRKFYNFQPSFGLGILV